MTFLKQPYPFFHQGKNLLTIAILILTFAFFFEFLLEPFNVVRSEHYFSYWIISLLHSVNAAFIYILFSLAASQIINEEDWKIYKEISFFMILFFLIGSGQYFLREIIYDNPFNTSLRYLVEEIKNTYLVGTIILFIISVINLNFLTKRNRQRAEKITVPKKETESNADTVQIKAQLISDHFVFHPADLLCIKSDGNYLEFFLKNGSQPTKKIKRMTLKSAEDQLSEFPFIIKTHRAWLVNIQQVEKVSGNAQGYQLDVKTLAFQVPVSRSHIESFDRVFK